MSQTIVNLKKQQNEQINNLKHELQEKDQAITVLTNDIQQLKIEIRQHDKQGNEQKEKEKGKDIPAFKYNRNCEDMLSSIQSSNLKNIVDFLLVTENNKTIELKNNECNNYNFGIFLLGENITLTLNCNIDRETQGKTWTSKNQNKSFVD
ncbi:hypothetical protein RFI_21160 [Reticulomyxa filosa]|uniref:Viral A-type inclusion protein n=1 Tax=Reticulomyxa filosa TaxID=46433 RepID=X6MRV7_RETFI|nr:hypothetical protein RFI_21160 [Reticulomyxa filosa]|eukprot:ETO16197.1 hypothetical protein RFI_21160 [Reticulomyxa filosa]